MLQALTRNPLADPGLLGINAGASAAVVTAITFFGVTSLSGYVWFAFFGAAAVGALVWFLGGSRGATPVRLALAGTAIGAALYGYQAVAEPRRPGGRYPHQGLLRQWSREDERVVRSPWRDRGGRAGRPVRRRAVRRRSGSGCGSRMALAQQTPLLLLDEPTTAPRHPAPDRRARPVCGLREAQGRTLVAVLHDLNHAARYATHLIALRGGAVIAEGAPTDVVDAELVERVFGLRCQVIDDPETGTPLVVPAARTRTGAWDRWGAGAPGGRFASSVDGLIVPPHVLGELRATAAS
ncbi:Vitamin B12 import ATP-binding protein BtuD [Streptomyces glaucescens]